jgi:hypothetical protein
MVGVRCREKKFKAPSIGLGFIIHLIDYLHYLYTFASFSINSAPFDGRYLLCSRGSTSLS